MCLIKEHNIPRLRRCRVKNELGRSRAYFDLLNAIEQKFYTRDGKGQYYPQYEIHFYAKSPAKCLGGFNQHHACKTQPGEWDWTMSIWHDTDKGVIKEHERAGYEVYDEKAKEWQTKKHVPLTIEQENGFVQGDYGESEVSGVPAEQDDAWDPETG